VYDSKYDFVYDLMYDLMYDIMYDSKYDFMYDFVPCSLISIFHETSRQQLVSRKESDPYPTCMQIVHQITPTLKHRKGQVRFAG
jgi:hypothetical protein